MLDPTFSAKYTHISEFVPLFYPTPTTITERYGEPHQSNPLHPILREVGWDGVDWIDMAQDREQWRAFVNTVLKLRVP
jgi:hypothetical protein